VLLLLLACATEEPVDPGCLDDDQDGLCNLVDNCPADENREQEDFNDDGVGDACDTVRIPLDDLTTTATYFEYEAEEATVFYFALLDSEGEPRVALDACELCYEFKRGYRHEGDEMVCNNCSQRFEVDTLGDNEGECNPGIVFFEVTETEVLIEPETLEASSAWFE
jgi:uncharacterized membrane protein